MGSSGSTVGGGGAALERFLGEVRRRCVRADLLRAALAAAALNEAARWASVGFIALTRREIPIFDIGPLFLLAVYPMVRLRWTPDAAARRADERGGLHDRLLTWLDFCRRRDVAPAFRRAQADEAARAIAALPAAAVAPLPRRLAAGPLLLAASLVYPFLFLAHTGPETATVRVAQRVAPDFVTRLRGPAPTEPPAPPGDAPTSAQAPREPQPPPEAAPDAPHGAQPPGGGAREAKAPRQAPPLPNRPRENRPERERPSTVASQRVGTSLAKLVDPLYSPGVRGGADAPPPTGTFAFRLLPKKARPGAGAGETPGEGGPAERVTVDFDALPEQYRTLVRSYFELLARRRDPAAGPPTSKEGEPAP